MAFPKASLQTAGNTHTIGELSWSFNGYAWDKVVTAASSAGVAGVCQDLVNLGVLVTGGITVGINPNVAIKIAGISLGDPIYGGITFADDTFQSTAATSSGGGVAGVCQDLVNLGVLVTGGITVGINPNVAIKIAGISLGDPIYGGITFADGTYQDTASSGIAGTTGATGPAGSDGTSVGYTAGNTAPVSSPTGDFWFRNDTGSYYANVFDGSTLGWLQISGIQGVTGPTPTINDSYTGLIESPSNKTYTIDDYTVASRTFNFLRATCVTGGCSADFYAAGSTLSNTLNVTPSGASASFSTVVPVGSTFSLVVTGITGAVTTTDLRFVAGYAQ
jgi:collagen type VII alpha